MPAPPLVDPPACSYSSRVDDLRPRPVLDSTKLGVTCLIATRSFNNAQPASSCAVGQRSLSGGHRSASGAWLLLCCGFLISLEPDANQG